MLLQPRDDTRDHDGVRLWVGTPTANEYATVRKSGAPTDGTREAVELAMGTGDSQRVGWFRFYIDGQRWEWSENVERIHGYEPGTVTPTTELLLSHKHPDDRRQVAAVLDKVAEGEPFSSRHRIVDKAGRTRWVIVVGDQMLDEAGEVVGTAGFYVDFTETMQSDISAEVSKVSEARAEIEQAKGLIMAVYGISADRAFDILVWRSQETNIKVREIAHRFLASMAGGFPAVTRTRVDHALLSIS
jgi:PAS domain S-box-containing protein